MNSRLCNLKMIVCTDPNFGIGLNGKLPWNVHEELQLFKELTMGGVVVMGNATYKDLPMKSFPGRTNIVLSRSKCELDDVICMTSREEVLEYAREIDNDVWIIGGREIYNLFIDDVQTVHISTVDDEYECDTFMSELKRWIYGTSDLKGTWERVKYSMRSGFTHQVFVQVGSSKELTSNGECEVTYIVTAADTREDGKVVVSVKKTTKHPAPVVQPQADRYSVGWHRERFDAFENQLIETKTIKLTVNEAVAKRLIEIREVTL